MHVNKKQMNLTINIWFVISIAMHDVECPSGIIEFVVNKLFFLGNFEFERPVAKIDAFSKIDAPD